MINKLFSRLHSGGRLTEFGVLSAVVIGLIGLFLGQILHKTIEQQELDRAVDEMRVLVDMSLTKRIERDDIINRLSSARIRGLQLGLRNDFALRNVHDLVLVNDTGEVIFASDTTRIGDTIEWSDAWSTALTGTPFTEIIDVRGDASVAPVVRRYGTVVRIYQPVRLSGSDGDEHPSVLSASVPYGPIAARISEITYRLFGVLALSLIVLYAVLLRVMIRAANQITQLQTSLVHAQKMKAIGNVAGGVAHDFNNLLAVISGNLELIGQKSSDTGMKHHVTEALRAVKLGSGLTHQLLAFSRKQPLAPEVLNVADMIQKNQSLIQTAIGDHIELELRIDPQTWNVNVDSTQMQMAVMNIAINARDAMPNAGKLTIEVSNSNKGPGKAAAGPQKTNKFVRIKMTDTGVGMTPEMIENALEPFFTTKDVGQGTGLGLPMAYGFTEQSGGHMRISSELGRGTSIECFLPPATDGAPGLRPKPVAPAGNNLLKGRSVLLVEDNAALRRAVTRMLERLGCIVHGAEDGITAEAIISDTHSIDFILCDVVLPGGMDGPTVAAKALTHFPKANVVFMSGYAAEALTSETELERPFARLQKPFTMAELADALAG